MEKGDPKHHDWHNILSAVGLLWADGILATISFGMGVFLMLMSIVYLILPMEPRERLIDSLRFFKETAEDQDNELP